MACLAHNTAVRISLGTGTVRLCLSLGWIPDGAGSLQSPSRCRHPFRGPRGRPPPSGPRLHLAHLWTVCRLLCTGLRRSVAAACILRHATEPSSLAHGKRSTSVRNYNDQRHYRTRTLHPKSGPYQLKEETMKCRVNPQAFGPAILICVYLLAFGWVRYDRGLIRLAPQGQTEKRESSHTPVKRKQRQINYPPILQNQSYRIPKPCGIIHTAKGVAFSRLVD